MNAFIDEHRAAHWVEPICSALQVARRRTGATLPASVTRRCCRREHNVTQI